MSAHQDRFPAMALTTNPGCEKMVKGFYEVRFVYPDIRSDPIARQFLQDYRTDDKNQRNSAWNFTTSVLSFAVT